MKFGSFSIKSTFFNNCLKVDIYRKWIFSRIGYLMTFSDLKNGYSRYFQKVDTFKKWIFSKSGYFQKVDIFIKLVEIEFAKSGYLQKMDNF